jgi:CheY-like chemotaxis protein
LRGFAGFPLAAPLARRLLVSAMGTSVHRILVIDDDPAVLSCYGRLLGRCGYHVATAPGGEAGLARLSADGPFDAVLLDYRMPGMDGAEFLRRMRSLGHAPEVILVSAYLSEAVRQSAARLGVRRILEKPVDVEKLKAALVEAIPLRRTASSG